MEKVPAPSSVSLEAFSAEQTNPEVKYGLPHDIAFCQSCVISNQRPTSAIEFKHTKQSSKSTVKFNNDKICDACLTTQEKQDIDWEKRERELIDLCEKYRSRNSSYDCVVPGSGGKDSVYAAHMLKYKFDMNPITITWAPHIFTPWGWNNFQSWIHSGFDNNLFTPNGLVHRLLTRLAIDNLYHPFQPFILGQKNVAPKLALMYGIPLIFYGENEAEYGNPREDAQLAIRDNAYFSAQNKSECFISGISVEDLENRFGLKSIDLDPYLPADAEKIAEQNIEVHYLGYYLKWHPQSCYYYAQENCGFQPSPERTPGTYSKYNSIDDRIDDLHYYTTFIKFGIGRATYDASQEIRSGDIDRNEGVALVKKFDGEFPERFIDELFAYLSIPKHQLPTAAKAFEEPQMTREYFMNLADSFRSPHLWKYENSEWTLRHTVWK